jgi:three-Cys-motif partner protein
MYRLVRQWARTMAKRTPHKFGGAWTDQKLDILEGYLGAYTTALQNAKFTKGYIDAFAGSGYREAKRGFPDLSEQEPQDLLAGSARRALRVQPRFDGYVFIESHGGRRAQLEALKSEFPEQANAIQIRGGDANQQLRDICALSWASRRAVLFLDPYGMQVDWSTIEAVARTKAIDMWLLFPVGIGVNRLLKRDADIPPVAGSTHSASRSGRLVRRVLPDRNDDGPLRRGPHPHCETGDDRYDRAVLRRSIEGGLHRSRRATRAEQL